MRFFSTLITYETEGVTSIGNYAFQDCSSLTLITIPNSVTSIAYQAFTGCSSLTSIVIPNSVTEIGWGAFEDCSSLTSITIPNSVTIIEDDTFQNCAVNLEIIYQGTEEQWNIIKNESYNGHSVSIPPTVRLTFSPNV